MDNKNIEFQYVEPISDEKAAELSNPDKVEDAMCWHGGTKAMTADEIIKQYGSLLSEEDINELKRFVEGQKPIFDKIRTDYFINGHAKINLDN